MSVEIAGVTLRTISIVDDEPDVRNAYVYSVEELGLKPLLQTGPLPSIGDFISKVRSSSDAAICDFKLSIRNYSTFDGAELTATLCSQGFPAILCTKWERAVAEDIRPRREFIPSLINPKDLSPETIVRALADCLEEFRGRVRPSRRTWRSLIRIEDLDRERSYAYTVIPSWSPTEVVRLRFSELPPDLAKAIAPGMRLHAHVNVGAESTEELYFQHWEPS